MFENTIIVIAVILVVWATIFSWRLDNGASRDDKDRGEEK